MIEVNNLTKLFDGSAALEHLTCCIPSNCIFGMVGSNGAGKSTFLRIVAGVYSQDEGTVLIDGENIWDNPSAKSKVYYVSDESYIPAAASMDVVATMHNNMFPHFNWDKYAKLADTLSLSRTQRLTTFSKGMRRQALTVVALACEPDYILFDETFDGLDPVARTFIKKLIIEEMNERGTTAVMTSHSLRELEDTCDQLALLHRGGIVLQSDIADLKTNHFKVQVAFTRDFSRRDIEAALEFVEGARILSFRRSGSVANMIVQANKEQTIAALAAMQPAILDILPLSLEELFVWEMGNLGYTLTLDSEDTSSETDGQTRCSEETDDQARCSEEINDQTRCPEEINDQTRQTEEEG